MNSPLVSIIIPTFNRAHLIGETLDSVLAQTYTNWECIVVDDGSTDDTYKVLNSYCLKDSRFKYFKCPKNRLKGANSARNYGLEQSKGKYVNWFDSDDVMGQDFILRKVTVVEKEALDFAISYSLDFDSKGQKKPMFEFDNIGKSLTLKNYISSQINWVTMDVIVLKSSLKNLRFNEVLKSSQEYNFFSRYLIQYPKGKFINECLAYRRVHPNSIQEKLKITPLNRKRELLINDLVLLDDIKEKAPKNIIKIVLKRIIKLNYGFQEKGVINKLQIQVFLTLLKFGYFRKALNYSFWVTSNFLLGKGYCFIRSNFS
ncbi:glycosyltransferase family 2 protein [Pseudotamlana carrageenivorans]|uniref:Glycosyltransferase 2-like domain-containing protein n=1 Tax=Pseudotamlana carrageenivorans TaxID=2069432 RepID=A0A2I7SE15_9FLAO|nr:glycosyltransferase family 2 protein [Tamlana carrageenivorans]AUS04137.1 hypothetical protein C1A40_00975 [Tamlana carrageenivorans]